MPSPAEESLRTLGLSQYEARDYLALLRGGVQNGHELSRSAGIPSSKVYAVLGKLRDAGIVQQVRSGTYAPLAARELTARLRDRYRTSIERLEAELREVEQAVPSDIMTVAGWRRRSPKANGSSGARSASCTCRSAHGARSSAPS